jgi:2-succinyl-5-enolpyruvyl-6-hydroxy-3-cyclohexene-1-carboxylate synthase
MRNKDITNLVKNIIDDKAPWVYQEIQSPFFSQVFENEVTSDEQVQSLLKRGKITSIIRIGDTPDSKFWRLLETQFRKTQVYHIGDFDTSALSFGQIIPEQQAVAWIESLDKVIPKGKPLSNQFSNHHKWRAQFPQSEPALILDYLEQIDIKPGIVLVGNSMPIRYARWYRPKQIKYMANRGANGIDGLIATAAGMAKACKPMPVYCLIGDLSFFYDLSALVDLDLDNLHICVVNNQGGRIFERLSGGKAVVCEHGRTLKPYMKVFEANLGSLIELSVDNKQTANFWEWYAKQD